MLERLHNIRERALAMAKAYASEHKCPRCGGELTAEQDRDPTAPVIFCVDCGFGGTD